MAWCIYALSIVAPMLCDKDLYRHSFMDHKNTMMKSDSDTSPDDTQREYIQDKETAHLTPLDELHQAREEKPSPLFVAISRWILSHVRLTFSFSVLVTGLAIWLASHDLKVNNSLDMFTPPDAQVLRTRNQYRELFGRDEFFLVSARGDVFSADYLKRLKALETDISKINIEIEKIEREEPTAQPDSSSASSRLNLGQVGTGLDADFEAGFDADFDADFDVNSDAENSDAENSDSHHADDLSSEEGSVVEETTSLVSARRTAYLDGSLRVKPWFDPVPPEREIYRLRTQALADPLLARRIVNDDGTLSVIIVRVALMSDDDMLKVFRVMREVIKKHQTDQFVLRITGPPAVNSALNETVIADLSTLLVFSGVAMMIALIYLFRASWMVFGPIVVVAISVIWTMGFMALCGMTLNLLSSILPAFLLCVGLGDSIHLQSIFNTCRREGLGYREAIHRAIGLTGPPILFTSLTTMIGLLSFQFASVTAIKDMGLAGGVGVMFAFLHSLITLPLFLSWQGEGGDALIKSASPDTLKSEDRIDRALKSLVGASVQSRGRHLVLLLTCVLACLSVWGISQLEVWHDDLETIPKDHPIRAAVLEVDHELGGVATLQILIQADQLKYGVKDVELLHAIESLSQHALAYKTPQGDAIIGHSLSITNVVKETRKALPNHPNNYSLPPLNLSTSQKEASQLLSLFEFQSPDQLRTLSTVDLKNSHITLQVKWREATSYAHLIDHIERGVKQYLDPLMRRGVVISPTGGIYLAFTIVSSLLDDLIKSFGAAFIVITFLMVLMLRSFKLGMLAMIPNLFPIMLMLGALGLLGIPLDLNNLLIASIALGIAVDDTIHLLHHFQASYAVYHDRELAISDALTHAGRAMLSTTLLLGVGFSVYLFASIEAVQRFGVIIAVTVIVALLVDLIICPAILRVAYADSKKQSLSPIPHS